MDVTRISRFQASEKGEQNEAMAEMKEATIWVQRWSKVGQARRCWLILWRGQFRIMWYTCVLYYDHYVYDHIIPYL